MATMLLLLLLGVLHLQSGQYRGIAADYDFEGDFFSFCDNMLDERNDSCYCHPFY